MKNSYLYAEARNYYITLAYPLNCPVPKSYCSLEYEPRLELQLQRLNDKTL